jgi:hypothetical protein
MAMVTDMGMAVNRRANVFSKPKIGWRSSAERMSSVCGFVFCSLRQGKQLHVRDSNVHCSARESLGGTDSRVICHN